MPFDSFLERSSFAAAAAAALLFYTALYTCIQLFPITNAFSQENEVSVLFLCYIATVGYVYLKLIYDIPFFYARFIWDKLITQVSLVLYAIVQKYDELKR